MGYFNLGILFLFVAILADIQAIYIRTMYDVIIVDVKNFILNTATEVTDPAIQPQVTFVEQCTCDIARNTAGMYYMYIVL